MHGLLNIASLLLGLGAWALPIAAILRRRSPLCSGSFLLCALSLLCQILYTNHLVIIRGWSAIEDTHGAVTFAAVVLVGGAVLLNLLSLWKARR